MAVLTFNKSGAKATTAAKLDAKVFDVAVENHALLKQAYTAYLANGRENLSVVKKRGEVSGGGKKPWKQKGTGRARFGSSRNPIWRGGGIAFGPTGNENYSHSINTKSKRVATRQALSLANASGKVRVIEDIVSTGKTAELAQLLTKIGASRRILIVVEHKTPELVRASGNLGSIKVVQPAYVNVYDTLNADTIVMTTAAAAALSTRLGGDK
ncbi:MAG: ribosomal protein [Candidatus Saccharibacteria bacterium]|nr:ribosomal protein [Candidatus Saccharibacteria bacterium]